MLLLLTARSAGNLTHLDHKLVVPQVAFDQEVSALSDGSHDLGCLVGALITLQIVTHGCRQLQALSDCTQQAPLCEECHFASAVTISRQRIPE